MSEFATWLSKQSKTEIQAQFESVSHRDIDRALSALTVSRRDFMALLSPLASTRLEELAQRSQALTLQRFGRTIQLFAPMYLSNECHNICTYCGFSLGNALPRKTLNAEEIARECRAIKKLGIDHVLLVTGESRLKVGVDYLVDAVAETRKHFSSVTIEVQPLEVADYMSLAQAGVEGVLVYQETYDRERYAEVHTKGRKRNFDWRLETPERLGRAGIRKIGIGVLLGLSDWRVDSWLCGEHLRYLERVVWDATFSLSLPRLRPHEGEDIAQFPVNNRDLIQLICAWRIFSPQLDISISTRESEALRNHLPGLGVTTMSAGSKTNPGGYEVAPEALEQFSIDDERCPQQLAAMITERGFEPVWKNMDPVFTGAR